MQKIKAFLNRFNRQLLAYYAITWFGQFSVLMLMTVLAHIQSQELFGFSAFSYLILGIAIRLNEVGINEYYLVNGCSEDINSLYILNILKGLVAGLFILLVGEFCPILSSNTQTILRVLAFVVFVDGFKNPYILHEYKIKNPIPLVVTERLSCLMASIFAILLFILFRFDKIVIVFFIMFSVLQLLLSFASVQYKYSKSKIKIAYLKASAKYVFFIFFFLVISYLLRQGPEFYVKNAFGLGDLGVFTYTYMILLVPLNIFVYPYTKLIFPKIVTIVQNDGNSEIKIYFFKYFVFVSILTIIHYYLTPLVVEFLVSGPFDVDLFQISIFYLLFRSLFAFVAMVYKSQNRQSALNKLFFIEFIFLVFFVLLFSYFDLIGVSVGMTIAQVVTLLLILRDNNKMRQICFFLIKKQ
jgi:O-antigen/teichoic acid export membrane protein